MDKEKKPGLPEPDNKSTSTDELVGGAPLSRASTIEPHHPKAKLFGMIFLLIVAVSAGFLGGWLGSESHDTTPQSVQKQQVVLKSQGELISHIAQTVGVSVVSVNVTGPQQTNPFGMGVEQQSAGTGIILTGDGLIVTNRHVVPAGSTSVAVTLSDGTEYDNVQVLGRTNPSDSLDVAFLKITDTKGKKLTPAAIGDSAKMKVGYNVVAIGNALGQFQNTVTTGVISGFGRNIQATDSSGANSENLEDLFQTDAAINEGNSGGPLVNMNGEVIGINTATAGDAENIGFAIPINSVVGLIKSVTETGKFERPFLGVSYISLTNDIAKQLNLKVNRGAYVAPPEISGTQVAVLKNSPAQKAGIKEGDIITKVDDQAVDEAHSLTSLLGKHAVGDKVTLMILRGDKTITVTATLENFPNT